MDEDGRVGARVDPGPYLVIRALPENVEVICVEERVVGNAQTNVGGAYVHSVDSLSPVSGIVLRRLAVVALDNSHLVLVPGAGEVESAVELARPNFGVLVLGKVPAGEDLCDTAGLNLLSKGLRETQVCNQCGRIGLGGHWIEAEVRVDEGSICDV